MFTGDIITYAEFEAHPLYGIPMDWVRLSTRTTRALRNNDTLYIGEAAFLSDERLNKITNLGRVSINELKLALDKLGVRSYRTMNDEEAWPHDEDLRQSLEVRAAFRRSVLPPLQRIAADPALRYVRDWLEQTKPLLTENEVALIKDQRERTIFKARIIDESLLDPLAAQFNISRERVRQIEKDAAENLHQTILHNILYPAVSL